MGVPLLSSKPGAKATLYLDFDGARSATGDPDGQESAPFDTDLNTTTFSASELSQIENTWKSVSEKFAGFDVNVTTVPPDTLKGGISMRVVVTSTSWGGNVGGLSGVGYFGQTFSSGYGRTSWAFSAKLGNHYRYMGDCISHEAGHAFGLHHQRQYDSNGVFVQEYYQGDANTAPIMGNSYYTTRPVWWQGTSPLNSPTSPQDDLSVLLNPARNNFDYDSDDRGNNTTTARPLSFNGNSVSGNGIIERATDTDYLKFATSGGAASLSVQMAAAGVGQMLNAKIRLLDSTGSALSNYVDGGIGTEGWSGNLSAGTYYLEVASSGGYSDFGMYSVSGSIPRDTSDLSAPSVSISSPADLSTVTGNVSVSVNAADNTGVAGVTLFVDGKEFASLPAGPFTFALPSERLNNGQHSLSVTAVDAFGNAGSSSIVVQSLNGTPTPTPSPTRTPTRTAAPVASATPPVVATPIPSVVPSSTQTPGPLITATPAAINTIQPPVPTVIPTRASPSTTPVPRSGYVRIESKKNGAKTKAVLRVLQPDAVKRLQLQIDKRRPISLRRHPFSYSWIITGPNDSLKLKLILRNGNVISPQLVIKALK